MEIERPPSSALIKRLRDASRARPRSLGFGRREDEAAAPPLVLIARIDGLNASAASQAAATGAAAVRIHDWRTEPFRPRAGACADRMRTQNARVIARTRPPRRGFRPMTSTRGLVRRMTLGGYVMEIFRRISMSVSIAPVPSTTEASGSSA